MRAFFSREEFILVLKVFGTYTHHFVEYRCNVQKPLPSPSTKIYREVALSHSDCSICTCVRVFEFEFTSLSILCGIPLQNIHHVPLGCETRLMTFSSSSERFKTYLHSACARLTRTRAIRKSALICASFSSFQSNGSFALQTGAVLPVLFDVVCTCVRARIKDFVAFECIL